MTEQCPFCKSTLAEGASVCAACGATYGVNLQGGGGGGFAVGMFLFGPILAIFGFYGGNGAVGGIGIVSCVLGIVLLSKSGKSAKQPRWYRRVG